MMRSDAVLRQEQEEVLASLRDARAQPESVAVLPRPGGSLAPVRYGRVAAVVPDDPGHGAHLLVTRVAWVGAPPMAVELPDTTVRCYPTPNREVGDYEAGEYVRIGTARGADRASLFVAEALA